jgi:tRNA threonylcarbamoyladenosine biosynthesis protein TsaE
MERFLPDEAALQRFAQVVARAMPDSGNPLARPLVIYLEGELGTGKTTFARAMLKALGEPGPVRSPTYGLLAEYQTPAGRVLHLDLYRIQDPAELEQLGLGDYMDDCRLWLVEWPARAPNRLPASDLCLQLGVKNQCRLATVLPNTAAGQCWVDAISAEPVS